MAQTLDRSPLTSADDAVHASRRAPVVWWAAVGVIALAFQAYLMVKWVTGPYFKNVPSGPSVPPTWMRVTLVTGEVISPLIALVVIYRTLVRPWMRDRAIATDGLLCLAFLAIVWQDPISNYAAPYLTYNSYLLNMGSWVQGIPGWGTASHPGAMTVDPVLFSAPNYVFATLFMAILGGKYLDAIGRRAPRVSNAGRVAILFGTMLIVWPIIEGGMYTPLGFFAFPGGAFSLFPDAYDKYPLPQVLCAAAYMVGFTALRYFKNDKGQTIAERGVDRLRVGIRSRTALRLLALVGVSNLIYLATYNIPLAAWTGATTGAWPADLQSRSYLTDYICGDGTNRLCPQSGGARARVVPFGNGSGGPFTGPLLGETR
ncbi:MAG: spirocyclase AveC family protein [Solirubrobacteraceae bacterium]